MNTFRIGRVIAILALVIGASTWVVGCKQGEGDRCQVNEDCGDDLVCNQATQECSQTTGGGIDATVPDAPPADAGPDAGPDAAPDAAPDAS